jgi:hypothetical protein
MSPGEDQRSAHKIGFGDIQMLSLIGPDSGGGIVYGVGVTMRFRSATDENLGQEKWQAGPAGMLFYYGTALGHGSARPALGILRGGQ